MAKAVFAIMDTKESVVLVNLFQFAHNSRHLMESNVFVMLDTLILMANAYFNVEQTVIKQVMVNVFVCLVILKRIQINVLLLLVVTIKVLIFQFLNANVIQAFNITLKEYAKEFVV
jgi:hypothetical protein